jgi:hypothetical protein
LQGHRFAERHTPDDRIWEDVDFDVSTGPSHLAAHDRRGVCALFGRDSEVSAVGKMIAVVAWRIASYCWRSFIEIRQEHNETYKNS